MKLGAMQGLLGKAARCLEAAAEMGLDGVELYYDGHAKDLVSEPENRARTMQRAAAAGVALPSLCLGSLNQGGFSSDDPVVRERALALVRGSLAAAGELGATVILVPFFFAAHPKTEAELNRVVEHFREVAPEAEAAGVTLAYEGELPADGMLDLLARIDSPAVRCYYDVGNAVWLGYDPLDELRRLREVIAQVHIKEFNEQLNDKPLGEGKVPVAEAMDALRELGYDGWVVLETGTFGDAATWTPRQLEYLRQFA